MGSVGRYLSGLCVAVLGLCAAGWLALAPMAFGYRGNGQHKAVLTDRATGAGLAVVSLVTLACWVLAWRRRLRADGILPGTPRRQAWREARARRRRERDGRGSAGVPDPARVLSDLRALLTPLLAEPTARPGRAHGPGRAGRPRSPAAERAQGRARGRAGGRAGRRAGLARRAARQVRRPGGDGIHAGGRRTADGRRG